MKTRKENVNIYAMNLFCIFIIFCTNILFNGWICAGNRVFYLDDLYSVNIFLDVNNIWEWIFNTGANKLRPVTNFAMGMVLKVAENNYEIIDEVLLILNYINALLIYAFAYIVQQKNEIVYRIILSCVCAMMFIASRFAYYNISELFGIMEGLGITFSLGMLILLWKYMECNKKKFYYIALIMYTLLIWTHERYFVLFILFPLVLFFQKDSDLLQKCKNILLPILVLISFWIIRSMLFGNRVLDGTAGTSISDTFNIMTAIIFCVSQMGYILGFNCGPQYLNGIDLKQVPTEVNILLILNLIIILDIFAEYIKLLLKNSVFRKENIKKIVLLLAFIGLCIVCSSITIRVEMRWIYVSYAGYLILLFYMIYGLIEQKTVTNKHIFIFLLFIISVFATEQFYRNQYKNIYYWTQKDLSRELYNVTVEKYDDDLVNKNIIIVGEFWKNNGWQSENWKAFFSPYINSEGINVIYSKDIYEAEQQIKNSDNYIVLLEDMDNRRYTDVTSKIAVEGMKKIYGIYEDYWCDMNCAFEIRGNANSKATLTFYYPDDLEIKGIPNGIIVVNGTNEINYDLTGNLTTVEIELIQDRTNTVQIAANYWVHENTGRSEDGRLSNTLYVAVE